MTTDEACKAFLRYCEHERVLSPNTVAAYGQAISEFLRRFGTTDIASVGGSDLVAFTRYLSVVRKLAPATVKRRLV